MYGSVKILIVQMKKVLLKEFKYSVDNLLLINKTRNEIYDDVFPKCSYYFVCIFW